MKNKSCPHHQKKPFYKEPLYIVLAVIILILAIHFVLSYLGIHFLAPALSKFLSYLVKTWWAILLGALIGGLIEVFVPQSFMTQLLNQGKKSIFFAVTLGFLASACSHGILAIALSLHKKGASTASTLAFLLAAPWANLAITFLLFSLFGLKALFIICGAITIALASGFIFHFLEKRGLIETTKSTVSTSQKNEWGLPKLPELTTTLINKSWSLIKSVGWWILIGFLLASFLGTYLPQSFLHHYFGPSLFGMIATLILASIIEVCSEGSAPLAFELFQKTKAFGNAFVFLQAGVITDFTEIGLVYTNIGKRAAFALILVTTPLVLFFGYLLNNLLLN